MSHAFGPLPADRVGRRAALEAEPPSSPPHPPPRSSPCAPARPGFPCTCRPTTAARSTPGSTLTDVMRALGRGDWRHHDTGMPWSAPRAGATLAPVFRALVTWWGAQPVGSGSATKTPCPAGTVRVAETWIADAAGWPFEPDRAGAVLMQLP